jgi:mycothiol synthase
LAAVDALDTAVTDLRELSEPVRAAMLALLERADAAHDHPPLPEPQLLAVTHGAAAAHDDRVVLARRGARLVGCALLSPGHHGSTALHLVVDPVAETGTEIALALLRRAVREAPPRSALHLWVMQATADDDARAVAEGFVPERDLLQMRVPLPLPNEVVAATRPLPTRPFVAGRDDDAWIETNNRAFAGHPEQGAWSVAQLHERMAADWVELDGFLVADDPDGPGLIGACWTKIHRDRDPVLGEIYVIDVDPGHHGQGWGRSLTVAGLVYLADRGITVGMLYTDATNEAAVGLYRSLGFVVDHIDRSYRRDPAPSPADRTRPGRLS